MKKVVCCLLFLCHVVSYGQDLIISSFTGSTSAPRYDAPDHDMTVANTGIVDVTKSFRVDIYLSTDKIFDPAVDARFGSAYFYNGLGAGKSIAVKPSYSAYPPFNPVGPYTLFAIVDLDNVIKETNDLNNSFQMDFAITASNVDFTVSSLSLNKTVFGQNELVIPTFTLQNLGTTDVAGPIFVQFYLSKDATYDNADRQLEYDRLPLDHNKSVGSSVDWGLSLPKTANGTYYILAQAESAGYYAETNEANNWITPQAITITDGSSDLEITSVDFYNYSSSYMDVFLTLRNNGTTGITGYSIDVSLISESGSTINNAFDGRDQLGFDNYLAPGETKKVYVTLNQAGSLDYGTYDVIFIVNRDKDVAETNYTNNTRIANTDLTVSPPPIQKGEIVAFGPTGTYDNTDTDLSFDLTLKNTGTSYYVADYFTLSILDAANQEVHRENSTQSFLGEQSTNVIPITLSKPLATGTYKVNLTSYGTITPTLTTIDLVIQKVQYTLTGTAVGEDGMPLTQGKIFLYEKGDNGAVSFVQQATLAGSNNFSFGIDNHAHTLYFIPDSSVFKGYVPTVYGKTVMLNESSFFTATANMEVVFEALKIQPLGSGPGVIAGRVASASAPPNGRGDNGDIGPLSVDHSFYRILLLSASGQVVGYTFTDPTGYYEFKNLPRDHYQVYVTLPLDEPQMTEPVAVDITTRNMAVNFTPTSNGITATLENLFLSQNLVLHDLPISRFGDLPLSFVATTDTDLPITASSADENIAAIVDGKIVIKNVGQVQITVVQQENDNYLEARSTRVLVINKALQSIEFNLVEEERYDIHFTLDAVSSSGLPVTFTSDNEAVATIHENDVTLINTGTVHITATQTGDTHFEEAAPVTRTLVVARIVGVEDPQIAFTLYPNPSSNRVYVESPHAIDYIQVFDILGKAEAKATWDGHQLDLSDLTPGVYLAKVQFGTSTQLVRLVRK